LSICGTLFDLVGKQKRNDEIQQLMSAAGFWDDQESAQKNVGEMQRLKSAIDPLQELTSGADDMSVLMEFLEEDDSGESEAELVRTIEFLNDKLGAVELQAMMSGPEDGCNAYVAVQAGEGGTDSSDWADMLMRMYLRWCEVRGFKAELLEISAAEEAGIRNATILISGPNAYGYLRGETGNHRLVRISPFDSAGRRHTSFAAVDVVPELDENLEVDINWDKDVREDTYRASGAGGQHVNKTDSAVRLTHLATGAVSQCQNERSQHKNRATARKMLSARLYQRNVEKREAEIAAKRGLKSKIGFGGETVRNYVLHPDQYAKDARTGLKVGNVASVLDGGLDPFLESFLRYSIGQD
jgi:peptide chain release factor 2